MKTPIALACMAILMTGGCGTGRSDVETLPAPSGGAVLTHTFSSPQGEFVRVFLAGGVDYEAELDGGNIRLSVRPVDAGVQPPRVEELVPGTSAGGSSIFRIHPRADAEYEFRSIRGDATSPLTMRLRMLAAKPEP